MAKSAAIAGQVQAAYNAIAEKTALSMDALPTLPWCLDHNTAATRIRRPIEARSCRERTYDRRKPTFNTRAKPPAAPWRTLLGPSRELPAPLGPASYLLSAGYMLPARFSTVAVSLYSKIPKITPATSATIGSIAIFINERS